MNYTKEENQKINELLDKFSKFIGCTTFEDMLSMKYLEQFKRDNNLLDEPTTEDKIEILLKEHTGK